MPNVEANVKLSATGGDEAALALDRAKAGLEEIGHGSDRLEEKFGHKFQHLGLQLFAGEALRAAGVGRETRDVVNILGMSISSMAALFGTAVGPIMLVVSALVAVYGIVEKVKEKHVESAENLGKLIALEEKERGTLEDSIDKLRLYIATQGPHAEIVEKVLDAKVRLQAFTEAVELVNLRKQIEELQKVMQAEIAQIRVMEAEEASQKSLNAQKILTIAIAQGLTSGVQAIITKYTDYQTKIDKVHESLLKHNVDLATAKANSELMGASEHKTIDQMVKDWQELLKTRTEAAKKHQEEIEAEGKAETERFQHWAKIREEQLKKDHEVHNTAIEQEMYEAQEKLKIDRNYNKDMFTAGEQARGALAKNFGDSFAKMLVEGKSFTESFQQGFKRMAEQIISDIIRIKTEWAILQAMGFSGGPGMGGGFAGGLFGGAFAEGGSVLVDKPTLFLAGEGGQPEVASFTPMSKLGSGGGGPSAGGSTTIVMENNFYGITDSDEIADNVGRKIIERIRGRGDLNFTRSA